jgi:phosphate transport system protein
MPRTWPSAPCRWRNRADRRGHRHHPPDGRPVAALLEDALAALIRRDATLAAEVRDRDLDIDQMYNTLFREFLTHMMEDPRNITACMHLHFIAKNIERAGDHATAIAEQVIYLTTGSLPGEARPKAEACRRGHPEGAAA